MVYVVQIRENLSSQVLDRIEPTTQGLTVPRSDQLSHVCTWGLYIIFRFWWPDSSNRFNAFVVVPLPCNQLYLPGLELMSHMNNTYTYVYLRISYINMDIYVIVSYICTYVYQWIVQECAWGLWMRREVWGWVGMERGAAPFHPTHCHRMAVCRGRCNC